MNINRSAHWVAVQICAGVLFTAANSASAAGLSTLDGAEMGLLGITPNLGDVTQDFGTQIVGPGIEFPAGGFSRHSVDITATDFTFSYDGAFGSGTWVDNPFDGFQLYDAGGTLNDILNVTYTTGVGYVGGNIPAVTFDANNIYVNFARVDFSDSPLSSMTFDVEVSTVPLPAAAWLFISALGGLVVAKRKQLKT